MSETQKKSQAKRKRVNVRRPEVMKLVEQEVANHYTSSLVEKVKSMNGGVTIGNIFYLTGEIIICNVLRYYIKNNF